MSLTSYLINDTIATYVKTCNSLSTPRSEVDENMTDYRDVLFQHKEVSMFNCGWTKTDGNILYVSYVPVDELSTIHFKKYQFPYLTGGGTANHTDAYNRAMKGI